MTHLFGRAYIEITNRCNRNCTFCPGTRRPLRDMTISAFELLLPELKKNVRMIFLHLMGEPLLHPGLQDMLDCCAEFKMPVNITTNGTLIAPEMEAILLHPSIRQINISFHALESDETDILNRIFKFTRLALLKRPQLYVNYRFWNSGADHQNHLLFEKIAAAFQVDSTRLTPQTGKRSAVISGRLYIHGADRFEWPVHSSADSDGQGYCLGMIDQLGVLADGTLVPCCLDSDGNVPLGNVFQTPLSELLMTRAVRDIQNGFRCGEVRHPFCRSCSYRRRFQ